MTKGVGRRSAGGKGRRQGWKKITKVIYLNEEEMKKQLERRKGR
jgi:hypothetical protein